MQKNISTLFIIILISILFFSGCGKKNDGKTYLSLMAVPTEATIPEGLRLDSILSITNKNPDHPEGPPITIQLGVFGFTNITGDVQYFIYGKKQSLVEEEARVLQEGFYPVSFSRVNSVVSLSLIQNKNPLNKLDLGNGITTPYSDTLPHYYTETDQAGIYNFVDAEGNTMLRAYAVFVENKNGNFFPAGGDGKMIPGALPIDSGLEECLKNEGSNAASRLLTTPIPCNDLQVIYEI